MLALAHCLSISSNADLQQQMIDEVLKDLAPACHHLQSLHQSKGAALPAPLTTFKTVMPTCTDSQAPLSDLKRNNDA